MTESPVAVFSGGGTGGHLYPTLALAAALSERRPDVHQFFVGAERGLEARVLPERGLDHMLVPVEGLHRDSLLANLRVVGLLAQAIRQVTEAFKQVRPHLVVVTGGYAGGPAGFAAILTRTRLVLQEQNSLPGLTTRVLALFAREVHLAFPEAVDALPRGTRRKAKFSGNPVRRPALQDRSAAAEALGVDPDRTIVLVTGGSQGSQALNEVVLDAVRKVVESALERPSALQLLWVTGPANLADVARELEAIGSPDWVRVVGYMHDMPLALSVSELAVSRAGAMTTSEFLAWGIPSILIPLPTAAADHQARNAIALSEAGAAFHLPQSEATGEVLWQAVDELVRDTSTLAQMSKAAEKRGRPFAASEIAASLDRLLPRPDPRGRAAVTRRPEQADPSGRNTYGLELES